MVYDTMASDIMVYQTMTTDQTGDYYRWGGQRGPTSQRMPSVRTRKALLDCEDVTILDCEDVKKELPCVLERSMRNNQK